ncbi:MAG: transglutaminase domain-containing protein, partial [Xanthomonadaceae bacterium]|nr:transglutaminase domain-containing protein [Xanthomonadaceae bacterium]
MNMWRVAGMFIGSTLAGVGAALAADATPVVVDRLLRGEDLAALVAEHGGAPAPRVVGVSPQDAVTGTAGAVQSLWAQAARLAGTPAGTADAAQAAVEAARAIQAADLLLDARVRQLEAEMADHAVVARASARLADWRARLDAVRKPLRDAADAVVANPDAGTLRALARALDAALAPTMEAPAVLAAGILPNHRPRFAPGEPATGPSIVPSYARGDAGEPTAADRSASADAPFSEEVLRQAQSLGHDAARIFDFVRGQVGTQWYAGAMKSPDDVLRSRAGNHVDQARLLVALLRASGVGVRYVRGVVSVPLPDLARQLGVADAKVEQALRVAGIPARPLVSSGTVTGFHVEQVWVAAYVPFGGYRGAAVDRSSPAWVPMMPALKPYRFTPARGATTLAALGAGAWIDAELAEPRIGLPLARLRAQLESFFNARQPPETLDAQMPVHASEAGVLGLVPGTTAHPVVRVLAEDAVLWPTQQVRLRLQLRDESGASLLDLGFPVDAVAGRRLTLSYVPATVDDHNTVLAFGGLAATPPALVRVRPVVMIDGRPAGSGDGALAIGDPLRIEATFSNAYGDARMSQRLVAGGYAALAISAQADPLDVEAAAQTTAGDAEPAAARLLAGLGTRYLDAWNRADAELAGWVGVTAFRPLPSAVLVLGQYEAQRIGAVVDRLEFSGVAVDAGLRPVEPVAQRDGLLLEADFLRWSALQGSALEHQVFEQQWGVPSVSADKALAAAPAAQRIRLTRGDSVDVLAHPPSVRAAIQAWLDDGKVVDTVRSPAAVANWRGAAWRVQDLASGESGWFIAGGLAGGSTAVPPSLWTFPDLAEALRNPYAEEPNTDPGAAAVVSIDATARVQRGVAGERVQQPLTALVRDATGRPVQGAAVTFEVAVGDAQLLDSGASSQRILRITDRYGLARVEAQAPERFVEGAIYEIDQSVGPHPQKIGVSLVNVRVASVRGDIFAGLPYTLEARPAQPARLRLFRNTNYLVLGGIGGRAFRAELQDRFENPISNAAISFTVSDSVTPGVPEAFPSRIYAEGGCGPEPVIGAPSLPCASSTMTGVTTATGAHGLLVPTNLWRVVVTLRASAGDLVASVDWLTRYRDDGLDDPLEGVQVLVYAWRDYRGEATSGGYDITAAAPGTQFPVPQRLRALYWYREDVNWPLPGGGFYRGDKIVIEPYSGALPPFTVAGATAGPLVATAPGDWRYSLVAGPAPGPVEATLDFNRILGVPPYDDPSLRVGFTPGTVVALEPPRLDPELIELTPFGAVQQDLRVTTAFTPSSSYVAAPRSHVYRKGNAILGVATDLYDDGQGSSTLARGTILGAQEDLSVTTVINEGTPYRMESPPARVRLRQGLIEGVGIARGGALDDGFDAVRLIAGAIPADSQSKCNTHQRKRVSGDTGCHLVPARRGCTHAVSPAHPRRTVHDL